MYETVVHAQKAAIDCMTEKVSCQEVDEAARKTIAEEGYSERFIHKPVSYTHLAAFCKTSFPFFASPTTWKRSGCLVNKDKRYRLSILSSSAINTFII